MTKLCIGCGPESCDCRRPAQAIPVIVEAADHDDRLHTLAVALRCKEVACRENGPTAIAALVTALRMTAHELGVTEEDLMDFVTSQTGPRLRRKKLAS